MTPDSHAHLDLIERDPAQVVGEARSEGVSPVITIGITVETSRLASRLASELDGVYASAGIHPNDTAGTGPADIDALEEIASADRVVAIGETGLDYYRDRSPSDAQKSCFREQARLARKLGLALIVHDRQAHSDVLDVLSQEARGDLTVVMHCFSGDRAVLEECVRRGYYVSFAGPLTFKNADLARETAAAAPLERLLVETDAPFLSPEPFRGKPNVPGRVRLVAKRLAEVRGMPLAELEPVLARNTSRAFGLPEAGKPR